MKLKKKRVRTWCPGGGEPIGSCEKPKKGRDHLPTKFIRCGVCNQRFEAENRPTCCMDDIHRSVPRHKAY